MLKYVDTAVTFAEFPNEITLCINISNCPCHCKNCHSSYLSEDIGNPLVTETLDKLITENKGITCVGFMGGDSDPSSIMELATYVKFKYSNLKVGWYSGREKYSDKVSLISLDYLKLGPYKEEFGPLNNPKTNQKFFKINTTDNNIDVIDCTNLFWKEAE